MHHFNMELWLIFLVLWGHLNSILTKMAVKQQVVISTMDDQLIDMCYLDNKIKIGWMYKIKVWSEISDVYKVFSSCYEISYLSCLWLAS